MKRYFQLTKSEKQSAINEAELVVLDGIASRYEYIPETMLDRFDALEEKLSEEGDEDIEDPMELISKDQTLLRFVVTFAKSLASRAYYPEGSDVVFKVLD